MESGCPHWIETPNGTLTFNDLASADASGMLQIERITGADGAEVRNPWEPRPQRHGAILHPFYRSAQIYTIEARIIPISLANRTSWEDNIRGYTDSMMQADGTHAYTLSGQAKRARIIRLGGPVDIQDDYTSISMRRLGSGTIMKTVTIPLISEQGYATSYATTTTDIAPAGSTALTNAGNAKSWPTVNIYGPITAFTLTNTTSGLAVVWAGTIANGDYGALRMDRESFLLNSDGSSLLGGVTFASTDFWTLDPGSNTVSFTGVSGSGGATKARVLSQSGWV